MAENIFLGREPRRYGLLDWGRMNDEAAELLRRFAVEIDVRRPLMEFSTAIQQMVAIARAVSFKAQLVIMDEPTSSLDEREVAVLFDVMRRLRAEGVAVIFISHRLDELYQVCDRVTVMRDGRTVSTHRMADMDKLHLIAAMLGRDLETVRARSTGFTAPKSAPGKVVLSAEGLRIGRKVRDARVEVREHQIVGLAGLLGSGRTEVARAIFGADPPDAGTIEIGGRAVSPQEPAEAIALGVGYCSEDRKADGIVPDMSVRENMTLGVLPRLTNMGIVDETRQREIVDRFMERLAIKASSPEQKIRELSGGNQQKVLLARWLCTDPKLLILDEPTRGIDVGAKAEIQALIRELADQGLGRLDDLLRARGNHRGRRPRVRAERRAHGRRSAARRSKRQGDHFGDGARRRGGWRGSRPWLTRRRSRARASRSTSSLFSGATPRSSRSSCCWRSISR